MQAKDLLIENRLRSTSVWTMQNRKLWFNLIQPRWSRGLAGSLEWWLGHLVLCKQFEEFKAKWLRMPREMATEGVLVAVLHRVAQRSSVGLLQKFRQWWLNATMLWCPCRVTCSQRNQDLPLSKSDNQNSLNASIMQSSGVSCKPDNTWRCPCIPWRTSLCMSMCTPPGPMIAEVTEPFMIANKFNVKYSSCFLDQNFCSTSRSVIMSLYMRHTGSRVPKESRRHFCKLREAASCHEHPLCFGARIPRKSSPAIAAKPTHAIGQHCIASAHACNNAPGTYVKSRQAPEYSCFSSFSRALATSWAALGQARLAMSGAMTSKSMPMKTVNETPRMVRKNNTPQRWVNTICKNVGKCTAASAKVFNSETTNSLVFFGCFWYNSLNSFQYTFGDTLLNLSTG